MAVRTRGRGMVIMAAAWAFGACAQVDAELPDAAEVAAYYQSGGAIAVEIDGNVAVLTVDQPPDQLRRGGELWARVGPYIYLFSEATREVLAEHRGLAAVRVVTRGPGGGEVASALLRRDALNEVGWRRALNIAGRARRDGTERVTLIEELVRWGEEHTTFEYHPSYVSSR